MPIEIGSIVEGNVVRIFNNGAIISLPENKEGFLHISEVSDKYTESMSSCLQVGQPVKVKIISIDGSTGKIRVSIKRVRAAGAKRPYSRNESSNRPSFRPTDSESNSVKSSPYKSSPAPGSSFESLLAEYLEVSNRNVMDLHRSVESKVGGRSGFRRGSAKKAKKK